MPAISVNVAFRPPRILTLIPSGSLAAVQQAVIANTHVWGGIHNPIVAVAGPEEAVAAARLHLADLVTTVGEPPPGYEEAKKHLDHLFDPPLSRGAFEQLAQGSFPYVDVRLICRHHFESTFRFGTQSQAVLPQWDAEDPLAACYSTLFGEYGADDSGHFENHFIQGLAAARVGVHQMAELKGFPPISMTGDGLVSYSGPRARGAVVGAPDEPATLLTYWNLRAAGCRVVLWPREDEGPLAELSEPRVRRQLDRHQASSAPHWMTWLDDPAEGVPPRLAALLEEAGVVPARSPISPLTHTQPLTRPGLWHSDSRAVLASVDTQDATTRLSVPLPERPFPAAPLDGLGRPSWLVTIDTFSGYELGDSTLHVPWLPELNRWVASTMSYVQNIRTAPRGVAVFTEADATSLELRLPHRREVVAGVFELAGLKSSTSPAGEAAERIIKSLGGLWGCRLLRLHGVRRVLSSGQKSWSFAQAVKEVHDDGAFARYRNVSSAPEQVRKLIQQDALRPGLHLRCPRCNEGIGFQPRDIDHTVACPRCGEDFSLGPSLPDATWKFQPSGFFANLRSHGSIPVVLTMIRFLETLDMSSALIVASQFLETPESRFEVDCAATWRSRDDTPVMAIAECKGGQQQITEADIADLTAVADRVRAALDIECYVVVATTRSHLEPEEQTLLNACRERFRAEHSLDPDYPGARLGPVVLAADQLDYHWPFGGPGNDDLPERFVHTFSDLAQNCDAVHFDPGYDMSASRGEDEYLI